MTSAEPGVNGPLIYREEEFSMAHVLLVDDERGMLDVLTCVLKEAADHDVTAALNGKEAVEFLKSEQFDLMITDLRMDPMNGMELLRLVHEERPELAVIIITAFSSIETAMEAYELGVFDYFLKPFKVNELLEATERAIEWKKDLPENSPGKVGTDSYFGTIIARSKLMQDVCDMIKRIAPTDMPVLISGPPGSGKKLIAETIHAHSARKEQKFVSVDCSAVSGSLEEDLFGHAKAQSVKGTVEKADKGTIFLESVEVLSIDMQERLVDVIKKKSFIRPGSLKQVPVNVRVVASTSQDIDNSVRRGTFRGDFYHLLTGVDITIPPLHERPEDILPLAYVFLKEETPEGQDFPGIEPIACTALMSYSWPGNANELGETIKSAMSTCQGGVIRKQHLPVGIITAREKAGQKSAASLSRETIRCMHLKKFIHEKKKTMLNKVIYEMGGDRKKAAAVLNMSLADLNRRLDSA